ncbi:MAG: hypothetical protein MK185_06670 [Saccharospirillaceae bacterium]|nr:hypothetical protein [Saccharospirillaceae bacterium]
MFKSKRRKELEARERELLWLQQKIDEMKWWCAADSPEIGHAMLHLQDCRESTSCFRNRLRLGHLDIEAFSEAVSADKGR